MSAEIPQKEKPLAQKLGADAPVHQQLGALRELGLSSAQIRAALGVSSEALRLWAKGARVRVSNRRAVGDIAAAALAFVEGGEDRTAAVKWLTTPIESNGPSPLQLVRRQGEAVIAAAHASAEGRSEEARALLAEAEGSDLAPDASTVTLSSTDRSSTQVNQLLLAQLHEIVANDASAQELRKQIETGYKPKLEQLPNYQAYESFLKRIRVALKEAGDAPAQRVISGLLTSELVEEQELRKRFEERGARLVTAPMTILTYALSIRVIQVLWGVPEERRRTCRVIAAEGRVKSVPREGELLSFADAAEILRLLEDTGYERAMVPDAVAPNFLERGKVELLLLGAQKVYINDDGLPTHFVGTAGTNALLRAAKVGGVEVVVYAEHSKAVRGEDPDAEPRERVSSVRLPAIGGKSSEHAPLLTVSAELCVLDPNDERAAADPSVIQLVDTGHSDSAR